MKLIDRLYDRARMCARGREKRGLIIEDDESAVLTIGADDVRMVFPDAGAAERAAHEAGVTGLLIFTCLDG